MKRFPVPISGWRLPGPALESMIERGRTFVSKQPRNLPERHPRILQILSREAPPQFVDNLAIRRAFISQPSREGARAEGQSLRHVFGFRFAMGQQLLDLRLNRRAQRSRFYVPLRRCSVFYCVFVASSAASVTLRGNTNAMLTKYEDNFGFYCIDNDDPEELEFFYHIRAQSEPTIRVRCDQKVRLLKHTTLCAACSQALEYGAPSDQAWVVPNLWSVVGRGVRP
jgi:hypothetical protein